MTNTIKAVDQGETRKGRYRTRPPYKTKFPRIPLAEVTTEMVREYFDYDQSTGKFKFKVNNGPAKAGEAAGSNHHTGYYYLQFRGNTIAAHRVAWLYCYGEFPTSGELDHINGVRNDNRIANLRIVTRAQNMQNTPLYASNKSGARGISWHPLVNKWVANINVNKKRICLGYFADKTEAIAARKSAEVELHPFRRGVTGC